MIFPLTNSDQDSQTGDNFGVTAARGIYLQQYYKVAPKYLKILNNIKTLTKRLEICKCQKCGNIVELCDYIINFHQNIGNMQQLNNATMSEIFTEKSKIKL